MGIFSSFFKEPKKHKDSTETVTAISQFLFDDSGSNMPTPLKEFLDVGKLDYTVESLKSIDSYLEKVRAERKKLSDEQLIKVIGRCGSYAGEVIRKVSSKNRYWLDFETAAGISPFVKGLENSAGTAFILFAEPDDFSFPLAKVYKFIQNGPEDSLYFLAKMILHNDSDRK